MHDLERNIRGLALPVLALALALGGCSGTMEKISELKATDFTSGLDWNPYSRASASVPSTFKLAPVTAADFVNPDGSCAATQTQTADGEPTATVAPTGSAVGLQMTECAVVNMLGTPERVDVGANERGERLAKVLYSRGERPGLYVFTAGRLTEINRVEPPEPPKPAKPQKKPPAKPAPRRTT